ncbi:hypothetical protein TK0353 [Thermococcus kodakarensis KOD1]|uniref:Uncharacterized protein n=1 Tax=Thermococcus kodakarensis (strain ATCC BAA-918 / JCM 12380 / KOD1) TaxID=69014 RepID=Q5JCX2_THEKO|nr:hypothetical protein [Thermococcus kodakarensis]8GM7_A Chain A, TK0353 [Thermococcus kodakarensis]8GM7_B Chain B, TK0353 [Thermococcus kodakarensis]8GM7_C Chain C, TK0353 [Thermococcus kodakarensis]8GM7_D Chain D, TK0353 [Thermococcus kodakarensis]8SYJ_A Chain A, TK0353 [Thermococcus kodakarensis]8SYJ_B Chain B, TK0353 [Thermococcus kodakarensis]8SYJ_C Chain C, TK0353 [Thermococcus kodakarensis]8SYJ_D Chain D, TK0353 [Thermococcus kodakarensis]WCN28426.1 hypothetical protein POG15_01795
MYSVKKSKSGYIFDKPRERIAFMFLKDGTYFMYHDGRILCYSLKPVDVSREELEEFERTGEPPELIKRVKAGKYPENCVVKELPPIDKGLAQLNPNRKCVIIFTGFQDTVIDYVECNGETLAVARLIDEPGKVCRFAGKGNYKVAAVKLKRNEPCLTREEFLKKVEECRK